MQWQQYVDCKHFPSIKQPAQLREYLAKWELEIKEEKDKTFDWMLLMDERTYITQNIFFDDRTWRYLKATQPNIAHPYLYKTIEVLKVNA